MNEKIKIVVAQLYTARSIPDFQMAYSSSQQYKSIKIRIC
jgi:hypothetical protein